MEYFIRSRTPNVVWVNEKSIDSKWIVAEYYKPLFLEILKKTKNSIFNSLKYCEVANINRVTGFEVEKHLELVDKGIPYLRVTNISECFIDFNNMHHIPEHVHKKFSKSQFRKGDIALTITGRVGTAAIISDDNDYNACQDVVKINLKSDNIDPYYLTIYLNSKYNYHLLNRFHSGGSRPRTLINNVREVVIPIPPTEIQKYIGDKVRRAEELMEEAERLKEEAEKIINIELQLNELQVQLKDNKEKFGWRSTDLLKQRIDSDYYKEKLIMKEEHLKTCREKFIILDDLVEVIFTGKKLESHEDGDEVFYIQSGDISTNFLEVNNKVKVDIVKLRLLEQKDILLAKDGETIGKLAVNNCDKTLILNEHTYCIRLKQKFKIFNAYIYYLLRNELLNDLVKREATGSAQKGLNRDFIEKIVVPVIGDNEITRLNELEELRCKNIYQSKQLIQQAKQDVENLIEGNFDMSKLIVDTTEGR